MDESLGAPSALSGRQTPSRPASDLAPDPAPDIEKIERASSISAPVSPDSTLPIPTAGTPLSLDHVQPVDIQIRGLGVTVDMASSWPPRLFPKQQPSAEEATYKTLLREVNASIQPGTLTAILGSSGSGKTTMLNTLAARGSSSRISRTGTITINSLDQPDGLNAVSHAYVMQQDILLSTLTVRETLEYSARLRLPPSTTAADCARIVDEVVLELGLKECADTRIGSSIRGGCSGGEKRRTSIGVQMLANPSVLFLDEPTTGLDSTTAFHLVRTLKGLADRGRTVITTIHQPRGEIWRLFDNVIILSEGGPVFSGPASDCVPWFDAQGFALPPFVNPAEFFIDTAAIDTRTAELEAESSARVGKLREAWKLESSTRFHPSQPSQASQPKPSTLVTSSDSSTPLPSSSAKNDALSSFLRQTRVLTSRNLKTMVRDPLGMAATFTGTVLMSIAGGYIFFNVARDQSGIHSRQGALYQAASLQMYLLLMFEVYRLTIDVPVFDRERSEGCVSAGAWVLSRRLARLVTEDVAVPFIYSAIFYFMTGFDRTDARKYFIFFAIAVLVQYISVTCAMTCVAASRHFAGASLIANLAVTLQTLACGMFIQVNSIPPWVRWMKYITYQYYTFIAYCGNEFEGNLYDCPFEGGHSNPDCVAYTGDYIMASLGLPTGWVAWSIIIMIAFVVFFLALAIFGLAVFKVEITVARGPRLDKDSSIGKEKFVPRSAADVRAIDVKLDRFSLVLDRRTVWGQKIAPKTILNPVTATFYSGVLNVIQGPSGSGKSSLLNAMALRLRNTTRNSYVRSGEMVFNGEVPSASVVRSVCSFVCQDDDALLPCLTVRETLHFAAAIRLPRFMSKEEKRRRADDVLLRMGLKDCANTPIGNEVVKGISGGEKRRVTIAVQILTDPHVLLLDEPTSGLDAFTASSIMDVLRGLASEGRTVILTIHQSRSDLFPHFKNVLLLARGGNVVYAGAGSRMQAYFAGFGWRCPEQMNPADWALDLITVDLREKSREEKSRQVVKQLVEAWEKRMIGEQGWDESETSKKENGGGGDHGGDGSNDTPLGGVPSGSRPILVTPAQLGALVRSPAPFLVAFPILMWRAMINLRRQPPLIVARMMQILGFALLVALFYSPLPLWAPAAMQNRMGLIQQIGGFYYVGMLQNMAVYPPERDVFYREHDDGLYGVGVFLVVYTLFELLFQVIGVLIYAVLIVYAVGLPHNAEMLFVAAWATFSVTSCGESVGILFNTLFSHTGFAVNLLSAVLSIASITAGIMAIDMPDLFVGFNWLNPIRYVVRATAPFVLRGLVYECEEEEQVAGGTCVVRTGEETLDLYKLGHDPVPFVIGLAGCVVVYRLVAWGFLQAARARWGEKPMKQRRRKE